MGRVHLLLRDQPPGSWVGLVAVLILAALPLLAASTFSAPAAQTMHPVSYLPLVKGSVRSQIAFISARDEAFDIYVMNDDGANQTNLTHIHQAGPQGSYGAGEPAWSPDGTQIAFVLAYCIVHIRCISDIYVVNADGSNQMNLTMNPEPESDGSPAWSPDGRRIAFVSSRDPEEFGINDISVMNADGSNPANLTRNFQGSNSSPVWSPDGRQIAFVSNRDGNDDIFVMNADGSSQTNLTKSPGNDYTPIWSPDGRRIAFVSYAVNTGIIDIYVINADGSNPANLTKNPEGETQPVWSPDGRRIAFVSYSEIYASDIYVMNADGSNQTDLTKNPARDESPIWSPDGRRIAFVSVLGEYPKYNPEIYVMNADGSHQTNLTKNPAHDSFPAWSPTMN